MKKTIFVLLALLCAMCIFTSCKTTKNENTATTDEAVKTDDTTKSEESPVTDVVDAPKKEPENANELWKLIDDTMAGLDSYDVSNKGEMVYYYYGLKMKGTIEGRSVIADFSSNSPYLYDYSATTVSCESENFEIKQNSLRIYDDGKMYLRSEEDGVVKQNIFSKMSKEDFLVYKKEKFDDDFDYLDCKNAEYQKNADGTWTVLFSGYTKKSIDYLMKEMDMDKDDYGFDISDIKIRVDANKDYCATSLRIEFELNVVEGEKEIPSYVFLSEYSEFNSARKMAFGTKDFSEVYDVRFLDTFSEKLEELYNNERGMFVLDVNNQIKVNGITKLEEIEKDIVKYGKYDGKYYYNIIAETAEGDVKINYNAGVQTVTVGDQKETLNLSDKDAKLFINGLIDVMSYDPDIVWHISNNKELGEYTLRIQHVDPSFYSAIFEQLGATCISARQTIKVVFENDKIKTIETSMNADGKMDQTGERVNYIIKTMAEFDNGQGLENLV